MRKHLSPAQLLVVGFAVTILVGAALLTMPWATATGQAGDPLTALFTATSATCVTGLIVVDTGSHWSVAGQAVILLLIQIGGLGIMTISALFALLLGKRISLRGRLLIQESLTQLSPAGMVRLVRNIAVVTLLIEGAGAFLLALRFSRDMPVGTSVYFGVFHSVSAFCNAGFDLFGDSLVRFAADLPVLGVMSALIILGGLGFYVLLDIVQARHQRLSLHSRVVLRTTLLLLLLGTVLIYGLEMHNPATLGGLSPVGKVLSAWFHAVTPRTAGYNSVPTGQLLSSTLFITMILMFIGASPGSTGGGIKTTTFTTVLANVHSIITGKTEVEMFERRLGRENLDRALAVTGTAVAIVTLVTLGLLISDGLPLLDTAFEAISAFGTVGLSTGITPELSAAGRLLVILAMFAGRVGPLTVAMAVAQRRRVTPLRYPEDKVMVG
ncbi:MAG: TrkH family potassium uptake protein [Bacillota bacterium]